MSHEEPPLKCALCKEEATTGLRGNQATKYLYVCSFHAGALQMIMDILNLPDCIRWRPLYNKDAIQ